MLEMIMAVDRNGCLGKNGKLPWRSTLDLQYFNRMTVGKPILMGRETWDGLPKRPLPNRKNLILSREKATDNHITSIQEALSIAVSSELMVMGGATVYRQFLPYADTLYITHIDTEVVDGDAFFDLNCLTDFVKAESTTVNDNGLRLEFAVYVRVK